MILFYNRSLAGTEIICMLHEGGEEGRNLIYYIFTN